MLFYFWHVKYGVVLLMFFMLLKPMAPFLSYKMNYDYISQVLCVNKSQPEKKCNGKCHLKKTLESEFDKGKTSNSGSSNNVTVEFSPLFIEEIAQYLLQGNSVREVLHPEFQYLYHFSVTRNIFHPPRVS